MEHPEQAPAEAGFIDNPWDGLRYARFAEQLERASHEQLLGLAKKLAYNMLVVQPAVQRFLIGQAVQRPGAIAADACRELRQGALGS